MIGTFASIACVVVFLGASKGQTDTTKDKAISQMRRIADTMKQCHEEIEYRTPCATNYIGPPTNLDWNVLPSKTVRSPFQGIVEFVLPIRSEAVDPSKQAQKVQQDCQQMAALAAAGERDSPAPAWRDGHYRYEFDLGSDPPELVKRLWIVKNKDNNEVISAANDDHYCWTNAARNTTAPTQQP